MGKFFKFIGWLLGVLIVLVVAAVIILPLVIDPNDYKGEVITQVKEATGRDLKIDGDFNLSVFPWLGIETGRLELSNAEGFGDQPFAVVKHGLVRVKLMPLLSKQLEVDTIGLDGLELNLIKAKDGRGNWEDLAERDEGGKGDEGEKEEPKTTEPDGEEPSRLLEEIRIGGIDISDARVVWDDRKAGQHVIIQQFNLKSGALARGKPVDLEIGMVVESKAPQMKARMNLVGVVALDEASGVVDISGLKITLDAEGETLPGGSLKAELEALVKLALQEQSLDIKDLRVKMDELNLSGDLQGRGLDDKPGFSGNLTLAEFNLRKWLGDHGMPAPEMADPKTLTRVGASMVLNSQGDTIRLDKLALRLDDTRMNGNVSLRGSAVGFKLDVDEIDADRYLPPAGESTAGAKTSKKKPAGTAPAAAAGKAATKNEPLLPVKLIRDLDIDGVLSVGRFTISKLLAEQVQLTLKAKDGRLALGQQVKKFYRGGYQGQINLDVRGKTPLTRIDGAAKGIQIGPLLQDLTGKDKLTGTGQFNAKLATRGNSIDAFKRELGGKLDFRFEEGAVKGINLAQLLRETQARFKGEKVPESNQPEQTDFSEISGTGVIKKGVLSNKDLLAKSPFLRVNGAGKVNLVKETLDYTVEAVIVSTAKGQGGEGLEELKGVVVPVHLTGAYAAPKYEIDWGKVLLDSQKDKAIEKFEEKANIKLPDDLKNKLKGLFN